MSGRELSLPVVFKRLDGRRFQVGSVATDGHRAGLTGRLAATAHARVETQTALVQVGVGQSVHYAYTLILHHVTSMERVSQALFADLYTETPFTINRATKNYWAINAAIVGQ